MKKFVVVVLVVLFAVGFGLSRKEVWNISDDATLVSCKDRSGTISVYTTEGQFGVPYFYPRGAAKVEMYDSGWAGVLITFLFNTGAKFAVVEFEHGINYVCKDRATGNLYYKYYSKVNDIKEDIDLYMGRK